MITLFILFVVIQSQITGGFTGIESNEIEHVDNHSGENVSSTPIKDNSLSFGLINKDAVITHYEVIQKKESDESDSSRRSASATNKYSNDSLTVHSTRGDDKHNSQQDSPSQLTESSQHVIEDDEKTSDNNDGSRGSTVRRILSIILCSIVLVTFGIVCIVGAHWFTYDKLTRRRRGEPNRPPAVVTVSSSYRRLGPDDDGARTAAARHCPGRALRSDDCPCTYDEAVGADNSPTTTTIEKSPPPLDDPPPPSYDECVSFAHTRRPRTRGLPTYEMTAYWYRSV